MHLICVVLLCYIADVKQWTKDDVRDWLTEIGASEDIISKMYSCHTSGSSLLDSNLKRDLRDESLSLKLQDRQFIVNGVAHLKAESMRCQQSE